MTDSSHIFFSPPQRNFVNLSNFFCLLGNVQHTCLSPIWSRWSRHLENRAWRTEGISVHIALPHSFRSSDTKWRYDKIWLIGVYLDKWLLEGQDWLECKTLAVLCPSPAQFTCFFLVGTDMIAASTYVKGFKLFHFIFPTTWLWLFSAQMLKQDEASCHWELQYILHE